MPRFGFVEKHRALYWDSVNAGIARSARRYGVETSVLAPQHENADDQAALARQLLASGVDGLGVVGTAPGVLEDVVAEAVDLGVPVVTFDLDLPGSRRHLYIGGDDYTELGREAGRQLAAVLEPGDRVLVMPGSSIGQGAVQKTAGFVDVAVAAGLDVVTGEVEEADHDRCLATTISHLQDGGIRGCFGPYAYHPDVFVRAFDAVGLAERPAVVAFDMIPTTVSLLASGAIRSSIWIREYYFGLYACAALATMSLLGVPDGLELLTGSRTPGQRRVLTPVTYDQTTVEDFIAWQRATLPA